MSGEEKKKKINRVGDWEIGRAWKGKKESSSLFRESGKRTFF
jgi:hypothetical protein